MRRAALLAAAALAAARVAAAAEPPDESSAEPTPGPRRLSLGVELSLTIGPEDRGFFNYTSYEESTQRLARLTFTAEWRLADQAALLADVRDDNLNRPQIYALYARVRPLRERSFDVQVGLIPPVFGAFSRRRYGSDNPLIGYPLVYQYLTSLRQDAVPGLNADLLLVRGGGWLVRYPFGWGEPQPAPGLPLVNALRWDAGVQAHLGVGPVDVAAAVTQGTLSSPLVRDDNSGKQISARVAWKPLLGLVVGASGARGEYLAQSVLDTLPPERQGRYDQTAWGLDLEYSRDRWILRSEAIWSHWETPMLSPVLGSFGLTAEARFKVLPGLYTAARFDHLGFSDIASVTSPTAWDAPVRRVEAGVGYTPWRHVLGKVSYQHNWRDGGRVRERGLFAGQLVLWF